MQFLQTEFFRLSFYGNLLIQYFWAVLTIVIGFFIVRIVLRNILLRWFQKKAAQTKFYLDDTLCEITKKAGIPFLEVLVLWIAFSQLTFPGVVRVWLNHGFFLGMVLLVTRALNIFLRMTINHYFDQRYSQKDASRNFRGLTQIISVFSWIIAGLVVLNHWGIDVTALIASIGIVGLAAAMAAKGIVEDIICYFTIILDKPFEVGDFISVCGENGTILTIGLASSRLMSLSGEEIILSNSKLVDNLVHNYKKMRNRRVSFSIGIVYETPLSQIKEIPLLIKKIIDDTEKAEFGRCHFHTFGDFSLQYEIVYFVLNSDYDEYMERQHQINIHIMEIFSERKIEFAYPTQLVYAKTNEFPPPA